MARLITATALLAGTLLLLPVGAAAEAGGVPQLHRDRLEIGRGMLEVQNVDWTTLLPYYTADIEYHDSIVDVYGLDMLTQFLGRLYGSSPDLVTTIEDETLDGDVYSATWTMVGSFNGVPYEAKGISIIKFRPRSREVYYWRDYYTEGDIMANIPGFDEAVLGFRTYYRCAVDPTFTCPLDPATADALPGFALPAQAPAAGRSAGHSSPPSRLARERLRIGRALVEINASNWQSLLPYYTEDYEYHDPIVDIHGYDTLVPFLARLFSSSSDLITTVEDEMLVGGVYTATWTMVGSFNGVPYRAQGMSILKFRDRTTRTYYSRDYYSESDIMATIPGLDQAVEGFRISYRCVVDPAFDCPFPPSTRPEADGARVAEGDAAPSRTTFRLLQNAPNPFHSATTISFHVPDGGTAVSLCIYDISGRRVRTLIDGYEPSGTRSVRWDGRDDAGTAVVRGAYFYRLTTPSFSETRKMLLLE